MVTKNVMIFLLMNLHAGFVIIIALKLHAVGSVLAALASAALDFMFLLLKSCIILYLTVV